MKKPGKRYWTMKDCNMLLLMCNRKQEIYIKQVTVIISFHLIVHQERERERLNQIQNNKQLIRI
jgi:hypothetical protein